MWRGCGKVELAGGTERDESQHEKAKHKSEFLLHITLLTHLPVTTCRAPSLLPGELSTVPFLAALGSLPTPHATHRNLLWVPHRKRETGRIIE